MAVRHQSTGAIPRKADLTGDACASLIAHLAEVSFWGAVRITDSTHDPKNRVKWSSTFSGISSWM